MSRTPFIFISDFKAENIEVIPLSKLSENDIEFCINDSYKSKKHNHKLTIKPISFTSYSEKFNKVMSHIEAGNSYLLNLTAPTHVETELTLKEIFSYANAHYKLRYKDKFVCFSPEKFIQISDNKIHTYPMKGTIDASLKNAEEIILNDKKELAEHIMVVDLLRNDLSMVSQKVRVDRFRYITAIDSGDKKLLQVSSHISGDLKEDWHLHVGDILQKLLPAGSISGTPKRSTLEIIEEVEEYNRGYFSGVFGIYDGKKIDSGVMIRFIEKQGSKYLYKSGGGITSDSEVNSEYRELIDKIYLP